MRSAPATGRATPMEMGWAMARATVSDSVKATAAARTRASV
jgi:hypothetical protein